MTAEAPDEAFEARLRRWGDDLRAGLVVYRDADRDARVIEQRVIALIRRYAALRPPDLGDLDRERILRPDWFSAPDQVGYVSYADRFAGSLAAVCERIGYLRELGVTYLHLMPLLETRAGPDDGGYAVSDFHRVRPDLGTMDDLRLLAQDLHRHGVCLTLDLVLNHVAREHSWARAAVAGDPTYRRYFRVFPDRTIPDAYERTLPEVFPQFAPGSFTWVPEMDGGIGAWVWTTFNGYQWDLDWSNPDVFCDVLEVVLTLANRGVDCLRLDAVAFLWKRLGTNCQNQPEVHHIVQALRAAVRIAAPAMIFKAEAIVSPEHLPAYLGTGSHSGRVCDLAYHNSLMVQLWSSLAQGDARLARGALRVPPPKPVTTAWGTYARCHDDIGWAISDADAAAVGLSGAAHRAFLARFYRGEEPGSFARGADFQANAVTGDARTSGTLASLAGVERALALADSRELDLALGRVFLLHAVIYGFGGIPLLYMGDEVGLLNAAVEPDSSGHVDNRWMHRPRMDWAAAEQRTDPASVPGRIFSGIAHLARVRARCQTLHAAVESEPVDVRRDAILALRRRHPAGTLLQLYNMSDRWQRVPADAVRALLPGQPRELISDFFPVPDGAAYPADAYPLPPYAAWWLTV